MRSTVKMVWFWVVAIGYIIFQTLKNRQWHMLFVDFEVGEYKGRTLRKRLIARKTCGGAVLEWQDFSKFWRGE